MAKAIKKNAGVTCEVSGCRFHDAGGTCTASCISVGPQNAKKSSETICATFKPEK